jgi:hypothetical protein
MVMKLPLNSGYDFHCCVREYALDSVCNISQIFIYGFLFLPIFPAEEIQKEEYTTSIRRGIYRSTRGKTSSRLVMSS